MLDSVGSAFGIDDVGVVSQTGVDGVEGGEENVSLSSVYTRPGLADSGAESNVDRDVRRVLSILLGRCLTLPKEAALVRPRFNAGKDSIIVRGSNSSEGTSSILRSRASFSESDGRCEVISSRFPLGITVVIVPDQRGPRLIWVERREVARVGR